MNMMRRGAVEAGLEPFRMDRGEKLLQGLDLAESRGCEIGALTTPFVQKTDGDIVYLDHESAEDLKLRYNIHSGFDASNLVPVDVVWSRGSLLDALSDKRPFDYFIASHVAEHIPDLIGWFQQLGAALSSRGTIRLIIPDYRYCFDALREPSRLTDLLTAHYKSAAHPQIREVIDSELFHKHLDVEAAWESSRTDASVPLLCPSDLARALTAADRARSGQYVDSHCWTFSLATFSAIMAQLGSLGLLSFSCDACFDTEVGEQEFVVILRADDREKVVETWLEVHRSAAGPRSTTLSWPEARLQWLRRGADRGGEEARLQIAELQQRLDAATEELRQHRASTSWKITAPLRRIVNSARRV